MNRVVTLKHTHTHTKQEMEMVGEGQMIRDLKPMLQAVISNILLRLDITVTLLII